MRRSTAFAVLSTALLALAGCKGPCRALSEKLCECETRPANKEQCLRDAATEESRV